MARARTRTPLTARTVRRLTEEAAERAAQDFLEDVVAVTPVRTGYLRSRWRRRGATVSNDTPYLPFVRRRNDFVQRVWRRLKRRLDAKYGGG